MISVSTPSAEELRAAVRNSSKDLVKILVTHRKLSVAYRVGTQLRRGYATNELLDTLVSYYSDDTDMMKAVQRCRAALHIWDNSTKYADLIREKLKGWIP